MDILSDLIFTGVIPIVSVFIILAIRKCNLWLANKIESDNIKRYLNQAENDIIKAVTFVQQTYVDSLKDKNMFNKEYQTIAFNEAKKIAMEIMGDNTKEMLKLVVNDIDKWVNVTIEQTIMELK